MNFESYFDASEMGKRLKKLRKSQHLTQAQLAEIYQTTQQNVSLHLQGIYEDKELDDESTHKK